MTYLYIKFFTKLDKKAVIFCSVAAEPNNSSSKGDSTQKLTQKLAMMSLYIQLIQVSVAVSFEKD